MPKEREGVCPIRAAAWRVAHGDADVGNDKYAQCVEKNCRWWYELSDKHGSCSMTFAALMLHELLNLLQREKKQQEEKKQRRDRRWVK